MSTEGPSGRRWALVLLLYGSMACWGFESLRMQPFFSRTGFALCVFMAVIAVSWMSVDARRSGRPLPGVVIMLSVLLWFVALPVYLVASRGWKGAGLALLHAVGLFAAGSAGAVIYEAFVESY
ncbi:MAG: hypothetical protein AAGA92_03220 [Planctomycetota bacterium]